MRRHTDRDVRDRENLAGETYGFRRGGRRHERPKAQVRRVLRQAEQFAASDVITKGWEVARLDDDEKNEARTLGRRPPKRGIALQRRIGGFHVFVRYYAQNMVGRAVTLLHPSVNVVAALDLPLVNMRGVAKRIQLLGDPKSPISIAASVAYENVGHGVHPSRHYAPNRRPRYKQT